MVVGDRGQAHTVEAFSAAIVLLASVVFALQVTAVTPLTASTASQHIENQQSGVGGGVLDQAAKNGSIQRTLLYWNDSAGQFHNTAEEEGTFTKGGPPTDFGATLNETFLERGIAFNVVVKYDGGGRVDSQEVVDLGTPSDNAVTVHRTVTLYDDDPLYDADGTPNGTRTVSSSETYFTDDESPNSPVFNVFKVELTLWRM